MEKISSILPKSPRTQNVDNSKAQPARPGAPLFGRPAGRVTQKVVFEDAIPEFSAKPTLDLSFAEKFSVDSTNATPKDRVSLSENSLDDAAPANYTRKGDLQKVKIAEDVARKFAKLDVTPKFETATASIETISEELENPALEAGVSA